MPLEVRGPVLMLVTARELCGREETLLDRVRAAVRGGAALVELRERGLRLRRLAELAVRTRKLLRGTGAKLLINGSWEAALAAGADGVHLREGGGSATAVRRLTPRGFLVGRSVHGVEGARRARAEGADYVVAGPVFVTRSKPGARGRGLGWLGGVVRAIDIPVLGIGGFDPERACQAAAAGAGGVAVRSDILENEDPERRARCVLKSMERNWSGPLRTA